MFPWDLRPSNRIFYWRNNPRSATCLTTLQANCFPYFPSFLIIAYSPSFCGGRKTGERREKPSKQGREPTTNLTWRRVRESNPGHIGGRRVLSPLRHLCSPVTQLILGNCIAFFSRYKYILFLKWFPLLHCMPWGMMCSSGNCWYRNVHSFKTFPWAMWFCVRVLFWKRVNSCNENASWRQHYPM